MGSFFPNWESLGQFCGRNGETKRHLMFHVVNHVIKIMFPIFLRGMSRDLILFRLFKSKSKEKEEKRRKKKRQK